MTRREELLRVARVAVNTFQNDIDGSFVLPSGHKNVLIQRIYGVLLQVEREVLAGLENVLDDADSLDDVRMWFCNQQMKDGGQ